MKENLPHFVPQRQQQQIQPDKKVKIINVSWLFSLNSVFHGKKI